MSVPDHVYLSLETSKKNIVGVFNPLPSASNRLFNCNIMWKVFFFLEKYIFQKMNMRMQGKATWWMFRYPLCVWLESRCGAGLGLRAQGTLRKRLLTRAPGIMQMVRFRRSTGCFIVGHYISFSGASVPVPIPPVMQRALGGMSSRCRISFLRPWESFRNIRKRT